MSNLTLLYIAEALSENYNVEPEKAKEIVASSFVAKCYDKCQEVIEHYDADYWAKEIMEATAL